jgi:signal transduction histidine kinase
MKKPCLQAIRFFFLIVLLVITDAHAASDSLQIWNNIAKQSIGSNPEFSLQAGIKIQTTARQQHKIQEEMDAGLLLAEASLRLFRLDQARKELFHLLNLSIRHKDQKRKIRALILLARICWNLQDATKAIYYYQEAARESVYARDLSSGLLAEASLAYIKMKQHPPGDAAEFSKVKNFYEFASAAPEDTFQLIQAANLMGNVWSIYKPDPALARQHYQQAIYLSREAGDFFLEATYAQNLAEIYLEEGKVPAAEVELEKSLILGRKINSDGLLFSGLKLLAECEAFRMDFKKAFDYLKAYDEIRSRHLNESQQQRTNEMLQSYIQQKKALQDREEELLLGKASLKAEKELRFYQLWALGGFFLLLLLGGYFVISRRQFSRLQENQKKVDQQNIELEILNKKLILESQEAENARESVLEALRSKAEFLSVITHEIRTPLHAVIAAARILYDSGKTDSKDIQRIETLRFASENLLGLINNVLDFNRIEAGKIELEHSPFSLRELLNGMYLLFAPQAKEKGLDLHFRIDQELPDAFAGDRLRISQIITNLLSNAIRFTSEGGISVEVHFEKGTVDNTIRISVEDSGIGITMDETDRVLGFFTQANPGIQGKYGGSGLGLSIAARLLILMNSKLEIQSKFGIGSVFSFRLCLPEVNHMLLAQKAIQITEKDLAKYRILFVEDVEYNRILARHFFEKWKINFDFAETGEEALQLVQRHRYDLILLDIRLPGISGYEAAAQFRLLPNGNNIPILAMSAFDPQEVAEKIRNAGMQDLINKPFSPEDLKLTLIKWLSKPAKSEA